MSKENPHEGQDLLDSMRELNNASDEVEEVEIDEAEEVDEIEEEVDEVEDDEVEETEEEQPEEPPLAPHDLWEPEIQERFQDLPRDIQQFLLDTSTNWQRGYNEKFQSLADERKAYEAVQQSFQSPELDQYLRMNGLSVPQATQIFSAHMQNILRDPVAGAKTFLNAVGVPLDKLSGDNDEWVDPQVQAANQQIQTLQQQQLQLQQQYQAAQQAQQMQAIQQEIGQFANATDSAGKALHPRFEELKPKMAEMADANPSLGLEELYYLAEKKAPAPNQKPTDPKIVKRSRVASKKVKSKRNTGETPKDKQSIQDYLSQAYHGS